jgi:hypothetical protein
MGTSRHPSRAVLPDSYCNALNVIRRTRKDQKCDTPGCRDAMRQRRHRSSRPKYEANRRRYKKLGFKAKEAIKLASSLRRNPSR